MPRGFAAAWALPRSREAMAVISDHSPFCIAGSTFFKPIAAVLRTPQRTLFAIERHDTDFALPFHVWACVRARRKRLRKKRLVPHSSRRLGGTFRQGVSGLCIRDRKS